VKNLCPARVFALPAAIILTGCTDFFTDSSDTAKDILYLTYICCDDTIVDTTFYAWEEDGRMIVTKDRPFIGDTVPVPVGWASAAYQIAPPIPFSGRTCTTFVDNPNVEDTAVVRDSIDNNVVMHDTIFLKVAPGVAMNFLKTHGPYVVSPDSIQAILDTVREGFWDRVYIQATHYEGDSAFLTLIDYPPFISFDNRPNCGEFDFYEIGRAHV